MSSKQGPKPGPPIPPHTLLSWSQLEKWRQEDNPYILYGHRPLNQSYSTCIHSILRLHNETLNIWSHLLGCLLFLHTGKHLRTLLLSPYTTPTSADIFAFSSFFAGVVLCLGLSTGFHTFAAHSKHIHDRFLWLDFLGILGLIMGSWVPGIFYGFYCQARGVRWVYWGLIGTVTTLSALVCSIPACRTPAWKPFRTSMFISLGLSGIIPMTYAAFVFGIQQAHLQMGWGYIVLEGVFYLAGALLYAFRIPERFSPGRFDIVGASHQWFHVLVLMGAAAHLRGIVLAFHYNHHPDTRICERLPGQE